MPVDPLGAITSLFRGAAPETCAAFKNNSTLSKVMAGGVPLAKGTPARDAVKTVQTALFSLGFITARAGIDGGFGPGTEGAVKAFQTSKGLAASGLIDAPTLNAIDDAAAEQIAKLDKPLDDKTKADTYKIVVDISNPAKTRLNVIDKSDGSVVAKYLCSPGRAQFPTRGTHFVVPDVFVRKSWVPPPSAWAAKSKEVPPGIDNPMGIAKLSFGQYSEFIHGIPASEEKDLGHVASHGCVRVSGSNVLEIVEKYAGVGTDVTINKDTAVSVKLQALANIDHITDQPTDAGREYLFGYLSGELGASRTKLRPAA